MATLKQVLITLLSGNGTGIKYVSKFTFGLSEGLRVDDLHVNLFRSNIAVLLTL